MAASQQGQSKKGSFHDFDPANPNGVGIGRWTEYEISAQQAQTKYAQPVAMSMPEAIDDITKLNSVVANNNQITDSHREETLELLHMALEVELIKNEQANAMAFKKYLTAILDNVPELREPLRSYIENYQKASTGIQIISDKMLEAKK